MLGIARSPLRTGYGTFRAGDEWRGWLTPPLGTEDAKGGAAHAKGRTVVGVVNSSRTQNGHIRNDTRDLSRHIEHSANGPICRRNCVTNDGKEGVEVFLARRLAAISCCSPVMGTGRIRTRCTPCASW